MCKKHYLRKELYDLLKSDETIFDFILEAAPDGLCYQDLENPENEWISPKFWLTLGYTPEEMPHTASTRRQRIHSEDINVAIKNEKTDFENSDHPYTYRLRYINKSGATLWLSCKELIINNTLGKPKRRLTGYTDISQQHQATSAPQMHINKKYKKSEDALRESEDRYKSVVSALSEGLVVHDINEKIIMCNDSAAHILGLSTRQLLGKDSYDSRWKALKEDGSPFKPEEHPTMVTLRTGQPVDNLIMNVHTGDGKRSYISVNSRPILNKTSEMTGAVASFKNITQSKLAEEKLQFQAKLLNAVGQAIIVTDPIGKIIYWNKAAEEMYGWKADEIMGKPIIEITPTNLTEQETNTIIKNLIKGKKWVGEFVTVKKNGDEFPVYFTNSPVIDENGRLSAVIGVTKDISERKKAEQALQESEARFKAFTNNIPGPAYIKYPEGKHVFGNDQMLDYFGMDQQTYQNYAAGDLLDHRHTKQIHQMDRQVFKQKTNLNREFYDTASKTWFQEFKFPISDKLIGGIVMDITDRKMSELQLKESKERYKNVVNNVPGIVLQYKLNPDGKDEILFLSQGVEKLWGRAWTQSTKEINNLWSFILEEDQMLLRASIQKSMKELSYWNQEWRIKTIDGKLKWLNGRGLPKKLKDGSVVWDSLILDITEQKEAEEVKKIAQGLEIKNKEMEHFAFAASHDLQEPLRTINSFAGLLSKKYKGQLDEDADEYLHFISQATSRMNDLIKGLLLYSRLGKNRVKSLVDCQKLVEYIQQDMAGAIQQTNAVLVMNNLPKLNAFELELRQLFQNLISNAIKFRKEDTHPKIIISAEKEDRYWIFSIKDNGIGISKQYHEKIFDIFKRLHSMAEYDGAGIGLANCKKIVELHLGKIWIESAPGQGSSFFFSIKD